MALKIESSLTDLMTSLTVVFIMLMLALVNSIGNAGKTDIGKIEKKLEIELKDYNLVCKNNMTKGDPLSCTITLPNDKLSFEIGLPYIDYKGEEYLKAIFPKVMHVLTEEEMFESVEGIYIEGFTDDTGIDILNLDLSQNRSKEVGLFLLKYVFPIAEDLTNRKKLLAWLHLNGRGEQDLILDDVGIVDRERSRRVEVTIRVKSLQQREVAKKKLKEVVL